MDLLLGFREVVIVVDIMHGKLLSVRFYFLPFHPIILGNRVLPLNLCYLYFVKSPISLLSYLYLLLLSLFTYCLWNAISYVSEIKYFTLDICK